MARAKKASIVRYTLLRDKQYDFIEGSTSVYACVLQPPFLGYAARVVLASICSIKHLKLSH